MRTTVNYSVVIAMVMIGLMLSMYVFAAPTGPDSITTGSSTRKGTTASQAVDAQAGNTTQLTITAKSVTTDFQGYYGNISGTIVLSNANNQSLYQWNNANPSGQIYASRNSSIDWTTGIACMTQTDINNEDTYLGATNNADNVNGTFNRTGHPAFSVGSTLLSGCRSTSVNGTGSGSDFWEALLKDNANSTIYTAIIDQNKVGFDNNTRDFQMLVGENGSNGNTATTTYYFYVELA